MSMWHDSGHTVVEDFLRTSRFGQRSSHTYRSILRSFEDVARRHPAVDRQMIEDWLGEMATRWKLSTLWNQVCIVDRFLDYLVQNELIPGTIR